MALPEPHPYFTNPEPDPVKEFVEARMKQASVAFMEMLRREEAKPRCPMCHRQAKLIPAEVMGKMCRRCLTRYGVKERR